MKFKIILFCFFSIGTITFSNGQIVNIPDANFKNALVSTLCVPLDETSCDGFFPVDIDGDGEIQVGEAEIVEHLCVAIQDIASLEGIQAFVNLKSLHVEENDLTTIDLSQNTLLKELYIGGNTIANIDISNLTQLEVFNASFAGLTSLDVTGCPNLIDLICSINDIPSLDLSQNPQLDRLSASSNELTSIDISQNTALRIFDVSTNNIAAVDLSQNLNLWVCYVANNQITSLDVTNKPHLVQLAILNNPIEGNIDVSQSPVLDVVRVEQTLISELNVQNDNNENFISFKAFENPNLFCIQVDDATAATEGNPPYDEWEIDAQAFYSEDCNLGVATLDATQIAVYPNPVGDLLFINSKAYELQEVVIYNVEGKQLLELKSVPAQISLAHIPSGILFVKVSTDQGTITKKIIKN